jgi:arabinofuranosyltransferase
LIGAVLLATGPPRPWRRIVLVAVLLVLSLTRPEGPFLALVLLAARTVQRARAGESWRPAALDAAVFAALYGTYFIARWNYFGLPFPNTYYAKVQGGKHGLIDGTQYTLDFLRDSGGALFIALALVPLVLGQRLRAYAQALVVVAAGFAFALISGGDWMFHFRFFAHILPILAALLAAGFDAILAQPRPGTARALATSVGMALVLLATYLGIANTELRVARTVLPALKRHNYLSQNYEELGLWFRDNAAPEATIAISDVGAVGYFSQRRILDMFGLIDPHIAQLRGRMHYKADPAYVLSRRPDYIVVVSLNDEGDGYSFQRIPDYAIHKRPEFHEQYEMIRKVPQYWQNEFVLVYRRKG